MSRLGMEREGVGLSMLNSKQGSGIIGSLYHYTSLDSLEKICKSKNLLARSISFMNDSSEFNHALEIAIGIAEKKIENSDNEFIYSKLKNFLEDAINQPVPLFIISFSQEPNLLSQWRSYTPYGKGVCIEFSVKRLQSLIEGTSFKLVKCIYSEVDQRKKIEKTFEAAVDDIISVSMEYSEDEYKSKEVSDNVDARLAKRFWAFLETLAAFKNDSFQEESEWRLISPILTWGQSDEIAHLNIGGMFVPAVPFSLKEKPFFDGVMMGPSPNSELALFSLGQYLKVNKFYNDEISPCMTPYREWP